MEKAFAAQLSQDKVGALSPRNGFCDGGSPDPRCFYPGVLDLHGGGGTEGESVRPEVRHLVLLLSRLLPGLHPTVALHQKLL